jgi:hypothetical protein
MVRFEEIMSGRETVDEAAEEVVADSGHTVEVAEGEAEAPPSSIPKGRRMRRFEEIMSGSRIPDPDPDSEAEAPDSEQ